MDLSLNKNLKLKGTPENFIEHMPLSMKEDIVKDKTKFQEGTLLIDSKNQLNKNFHIYAVIYNDLNDKIKNRKKIYVYYHWSNIPHIFFKYTDSLQLSMSSNCIIVPKSWLEMHTIYQNDYYKTFKNNNIKDISATNIEWDTLINKIELLSIKKNIHVYGYRKVIIEKTYNNTNPIEINIKCNHNPCIKSKVKLLIK